MSQLTKTEDGVSVLRLDKRTDAPFPTNSLAKLACAYWRTCETSVRMRLKLDAEWGDTHPHVLTVADADRVVSVMRFESADNAKQAYDTMDETFRSLEKGTRRVAFVRFWGRQILSFAAVAAFVWLVIALVS